LKTYSESFEFDTKGELHIINVTEDVEKTLKNSGLKNGIACLFTTSSTSAITTIEYEPGLLQDLPAALERLFPKKIRYEHEERWHDGNGHSHVRASFLGPSLTIPFQNSRPILGTWQQIVFVELDIRGRRRKIVVQAIGE